VSIFDAPGTALVLVDLQNDFIHPDGAYARGGATADEIAALPDRLRPLADAARNASAPVIATLFTLVPTPGGPIISPHLAELRPFLTTGDFEPGRWGHGVVDELAPVDVTVEKVAYSAFHASRLEYVLQRLDVRTLVVAGIVTNGGVASTVRAAHVLDYSTIVVENGCAAFSASNHNAAIASLATISRIGTIDELLATS